ncbi:sugar ABC transporter permease [Bengtsoniella intestinalis]|uniref:carbohydrate ABC transporter permease n=1 Tax=Bengtsoniella intestinalis TaxID=3073143 RepID=UPI00391F4978
MARTPSRSQVLARRETISAYLFLAPAMLFFVAFVVIPMGISLVTSFYEYNMSGSTFSGIDNYVRMFQDAVFMKALKNTVLIVVVAVPTVTAFSLWVATAINPMKPVARSFYRCVFYLPVVTGSVAVTVVWKWMFNAYTGLLNSVLGTTGYSWLGQEKTAIWCIILILFTTSIGQPIVLYVAALGNVDRSLVEAAHVDGANGMQAFWKIKWPQMMPTTLYILVITTINSFQCFALIQLLTSGGPNNSTQTIMYYIYYNVYKLNDFGYANAMGIVLALIIALFSAAQFALAKSEH